MIELLTSGLYTSIQDLGRFGYRKYGVPVSGAMDLNSMQFANQLVGNKHNLGVMEITSSGPLLKFHKEAQIAICGAQFPLFLNDERIALGTKTSIPAGALLKFGSTDQGLRAYLAVAGGFKSEEVMSSVSQYSGITSKKRVTRGDILKVGTNGPNSESDTQVIVDGHRNIKTNIIEVHCGPEFELLSKTHQDLLFNTSFIIGPESNRMAYVLEHQEVLSIKEIISSAVQPGTVQLMPSGRLVILMRDAQTSGGYARIFQLNENSINILAQKRTDEEIQFICL